jgi:hypothetical protein
LSAGRGRERGREGERERGRERESRNRASNGGWWFRFFCRGMYISAWSDEAMCIREMLSVSRCPITHLKICYWGKVVGISIYIYMYMYMYINPGKVVGKPVINKISVNIVVKGTGI